MFIGIVTEHSDYGKSACRWYVSGTDGERRPSHSKGSEFEGTALVGEAFTVDAGVGYLDAAFTRLAPGSYSSTSTQFTFAPHWSVNVGTQYAIGLGSYGALTPRIDMAYKSHFFTELANMPPAAQDGYWAGNLHLTYTPQASAWEIAGFVNNFTNKLYELNARGSLGVGFVERLMHRPGSGA